MQFSERRFGKFAARHALSTQQPTIAEVDIDGIRLKIVESDVEALYRALDKIFLEGKHQRSLEIQTVLNNGEQNVSQHVITIADKRKGD